MIILCDLSEVLIGGWKTALKDIRAEYGLITWLRMLMRFKKVREDFDDVLRGKTSKADGMKSFFAKTSLPLSQEELEIAFEKSIRKKVPGTWEIISRIDSHPANLKNRDVMVFGKPEIHIVTDNTPEYIALAKEAHPDIFSQVKEVHISSEIGMVKKDFGFFSKFLKTNNMDPNECLSIDDSRHNVERAIEAGITGIVHDNEKDLCQQLKNLSIRIR